MYRIDLKQNRLSRLVRQKFSDLNLRERDHLQEWIAHQPDALGEELLIIQKEFDGFDDTRERLDLLALDKDGRLVVIENKLDDTGRDVVWQSLKYTAYVSGLRRDDVFSIFQQYLDRYCGGGNAHQLIADFLEVGEIENVVLNPGNDQRIMLVAANFRKEVTSTALWLISRGIDVKCFKVTPFKFGEELLLDMQQIIPTPEAQDFMISMSSKDQEEKSNQKERKHRHQLRLDFWEQALDVLANRGIELYSNISPSKDHWLSAGSGISSCPYQMHFLKDCVRVGFVMQKADAENNKWIFDRLYERKNEIESAFGAAFEWARLDDKKASWITFQRPFNGYNREEWPEMIAWLVEHIQKIENAFKDHLVEINSAFRQLEKGR